MNVVLGGGLAGLAAGHRLTSSGCPTVIVEKGSRVGGLARTIHYSGFRFDLGGHRFLTDNERVMSLVSELLGEELLTVPRSSQIFMHGKFVDYPLNPVNALFGLGLSTTASIILDYGREKVRQAISKPPMISLEDWVVAQFGRRMFDLYFRDYSERVWGLDCSAISMEWVAKRIDGLSLWKAVKHALFKVNGRGCKTLTDSFVYPRLGIGQLSDRLRDYIAARNQVRTSTEVQQVYHTAGMITGVELRDDKGSSLLRGDQYFSSIPLTMLLEKMCPRPPEEVMAAVARISFRSLIVVSLMLNRQKVTDLTWLYFPGKDVPFGRIHEPTNWSPEMAPAGQTHLVTEYFCDRHDQTWDSTDEHLASTTAEHLQRLKFIDPSEVTDSCVLRVPYAYPIFNIDYRKNLQVITDWLDRFDNLQLIGRSGRYSYLNMDCAMESGIEAVERVIARSGASATFSEKMAAAASLV
jgi:protoporphyrinogen oxidase